ncbi:hypothetical protein AOQ84DRAFT_294587, partial [Glonium stellatum]
PLLFPFLVLEAKGEKGTENFGHMEIQTAFPIKNALELQYNLLKTHGNTMDVPGGPLVWFLAYRGEDWRVYGAVIYEEEGRPNYYINHLWSGTITGSDEALQLVLVVDYILDWARDIYRPNILRQLRTLSTLHWSDAMTVPVDPDIYSLRGEVQPWMEGHDLELDDINPSISDTASVTFEDDPVDHLSKFKTAQGLVRDGRFIESRLRALYITRDNVQTLLQGFENPNAAMRFARSVLAALSRRCVALESDDVLDDIEDKWTGNARPKTTLPGQKSKIYAQFRISYFINPAWEQIRELTYIAASDEAREILIGSVKFRSAVRRSGFAPPECPKEDIINSIHTFLQRSVRHDFMSTLVRRTYAVDMADIPVTTPDSNERTQQSPPPRMVIKLDKDKTSPGVATQGIVHGIYEKYRIGKREPNEPFLRVSARVDCEGRPLWKGWKSEDRFYRSERHLHGVLVYGKLLKRANLHQGSEQKLCLYILNGQTEHIDTFRISWKLIWFLFRDHIYSTVRKSKVYKTSRNWQDNRTGYYLKMSEAPKHLKISRDALRQIIFDWIKSMNPPTKHSVFQTAVFREKGRNIES